MTEEKKKFTFDEYSKIASSTAIYPNELSVESHHKIVGILYCALKLSGESGEVAEHIGKSIRDDFGRISDDRLWKLKKELGDVLWYVNELSQLLGFTLEDVAIHNNIKLIARKENGTINGSGSDR